MASKGTALYGSRIDLSNKNDPLTMVLDMVDTGSKVLDVGCGVGNMAAFLSGVKNCEVTAIEISPLAANRAKAFCRRIIVGNIEKAEVRQDVLDESPFDYVIFADVLEHLANPWTVLEAMAGVLAPTGRVLISLPNVAHWTIRLRLLIGRFDYTEGFLLDRTHLRFFTLFSARRMVGSCGYEVERELIRWDPFPGDRLWRMVPFLRDSVNGLLAKVFPGLYGYQFVYCLRKAKG